MSIDTSYSTIKNLNLKVILKNNIKNDFTFDLHINSEFIVNFEYDNCNVTLTHESINKIEYYLEKENVGNKSYTDIKESVKVTKNGNYGTVIIFTLENEIFSSIKRKQLIKKLIKL